MPGPAPKDPSLRQRRNKPATSAELPSEAAWRARVKVPPLPNRGRGRAWQPRTKRWWTTVWQSPLASRYKRVHLDSLLALAELVDERNKTPASNPYRLKLEAEIRMQSRAFGLVPTDQLRLGWQDAPEADRPLADAPADTRRAALSEPDEPDVDPRTVLRAVK